MTQTKAGSAPRATLSVRSGVSRKTLTAEALKAASSLAGEPIEADSPPATPPQPRGHVPASLSAATADAPLPADQAPAWSHEDEAALSALIARRKAAGFQRRGRDVGSQLLRAGEIKPNPDTVAATIVGLIGPRESVTRSELLGLMASATFPHPKAQPKDKGWCQGYVAGLIRGGFLSVVEKAETPAAQAA